MYKINFKRHSVLILLLVAATLLSACGPGTTVTEVATADPGTLTEAVPEITSTPTLGVSTVLMVTSPDSDPGTVARLQSALETLAAGSSLALTVVDSLTPDQLTENVKVVVGVGTGTDLAALALAAPAVQFVVIDQPGAVPSANLSVIGNPQLEEERQSFMGGFLAALVSADYKVAGLIPSDIPLTAEAQNAYLIGTRFFCGLCKPKYPPYNAFPQLETLPVASDANAFQNVVTTLVDLGVEVVYVHGELIRPDLLNILSDSGLEVVGGASPDMARNNWVGTVAVDPSPALAAIWGDLMAGNPGQQLPGAIVLLDQEAGLVSEGRMQLFNEMKADLESNLVLPDTQH